MPRISRSSISNGDPGPVNAACAAASETAGKLVAPVMDPPFFACELSAGLADFGFQ
jgi:hypothetical protein